MRRIPYGLALERLVDAVAATPGSTTRDLATLIYNDRSHIYKALVNLRKRERVFVLVRDGHNTWYATSALRDEAQRVDAETLTTVPAIGVGSGNNSSNRYHPKQDASAYGVTLRDMEATHGPVAGWSRDLHAVHTTRMCALSGLTPAATPR